MPKIETAFSVTRNGSMVKISYDGDTKTVIFRSENVAIQVEDGNFVSMSDLDKVFVLDFTVSVTPTGTSPSNYADNLANLINDPQNRLDLARGIVSDKKTVYIFGSNPSVGTTVETLWNTGGTYTFLTAADNVRVAAGGNAADTAAGVGARTIVVEGLDANYVEITETITLNGTSVSSSTTLAFLRVNNVSVLAVGAVGSGNTGDIVLETNGAIILCTIAAGFGQSTLGIFTIPDGKTGFISALTVNVDASKTGTLTLFECHAPQTGSAPFGARHVLWRRGGVVGQITELFDASGGLDSRSDIEFRGVISTGTAEFDCTINLLLVDDTP